MKKYAVAYTDIDGYLFISLKEGNNEFEARSKMLDEQCDYSTLDEDTLPTNLPELEDFERDYEFQTIAMELPE